jgi:histidyl-tRNA synthetase
MDKQFKYAERKNIPYIAIVGSKEIASGTVVIKNLGTGEQTSYSSSEFIDNATEIVK